MMFGHRRLASQPDAYVDGELELARLATIESHLDECPDCDAHVRFLLSRVCR